MSTNIIIMLSLSTMFVIIIGLLASRQKHKLISQKLEYELLKEKQRRQQTPQPQTRKEKEIEKTGITLTEKNRIIKDYTNLNFNLSASLLDSYKITEYKSRTDFQNFIEADIQKGLKN